MPMNRAETKKLAGYIAGTVVAAGISSLVGGFLSATVASTVLQKLAESDARDEIVNFLKSISGNFFSDFSKSMGSKVSERVQREKLQAANHHLQRSFKKAAKYALIDIGGKENFAEEWQTQQHEKNKAAHPILKDAAFAGTKEYLKWAKQQPVLAKATLHDIGKLFRELIKLIDADLLLPISPSVAETPVGPAVNDIHTLMHVTEPNVFSAAFCEYIVSPVHDAYLNICNVIPVKRDTNQDADEGFFAQHLHQYLLSCTLAHFGEILKTDTAPYRAYVRAALSDMRDNLHDIKSDNASLQAGQAQIVAKIDGLIAQSEMLGDGKTLDLLNDHIADLVGALGRAEQRDAQNFNDLLVFVTQHSAARDTKYDDTLNQILAALQRHLGEQRATSDVYNVEGLPSPYLGLAAYTFNDSDKFGGRDDEIKQVLASLTSRDRERNLLFIVGASGCGKSSFAQAGIAPALQQHYAALGKTLAYTVMRPSNNPIGNLKDALDHLEIANASIDVLVIDQAEELYTQANEADRSQFLQWLHERQPFAQSQQFVIVTLRHEYENEFANRLGAMDIYDLEGMSKEHLKQAITQPIASAYPDRSKQIEPALVDKLALEAAERPTLLPLVQATLTELWKKGRMTLANYGRLTDAIDQLADTVYRLEDPSPRRRNNERSPENQRALMGIFTDLVKVSLDNDGRDVRRSLPREAFGGERADLIAELINKRLLALDNNQVSIIHEALIEHWRQLHVALTQKDNRHYLQLRGRFELNLAQWQAHGQAPDRYLLQDEELDEARELEMRDDVVLRAFPAAREFLRVSRDAIEAKRQKAAADAKKHAEVLAAANTRLRTSQSRLRVAFVGVLALALVASGLGGWAYVERNNAVNAEERAIRERDNAANAEALAIKERNNAIEAQKIGRSRELATIAQTQLDVNVETSVLIAIEANQIAHTNESRTILQQGLEKSVKSKRLSGHAGWVNNAAWSPDGKQVLTISDDGTARIWEASSGKMLSVLSGHTNSVISAVWSPDGKQVLTASDDNTARIWEASSGKMLGVLSEHTDSVNSAVWSPDGKQVLTASDDNTARIWDTSSGKTLRVLSKHTGSVDSAVWSPDGKQVLTISDDKTARIWDASSGKMLNVLSAAWVSSAVWSPDGKQVLTASHDGTAWIWEASSGETLSVLEHTRSVNSAVWSPDGKQVLTAGGDNTTRIWDASSGETLSILSGHTGSVNSAVWSPDGKQVLTASWDKTARIWEASSGKTLSVLSGHTNSVNSAVWSPDGKQVLTASWDKTARIWDVSISKTPNVLRGHTNGVLSATWSPDGKQVLAASWDATARIWEASSGNMLSVLSGHTNLAISAVWSPDGKQVLTASLDDTARIWEASSGKTLNVLSGHTDGVLSATWSPDGKQVLTASADNTARIWEASSGKVLVVLSGHTDRVWSAAWSPDGKQVLTTSLDKTAQIWDASSGKVLVVLSGHTDGVKSAVWSPDGKQVLTTSLDETAQIWDASSGKVLVVLSGHTDRVWSAAWSPDGKQVLTASDDKTARIWDASSRKTLSVLNGHTGGVSSAAWSPDGKQVLIASFDNTARLYYVNIEDLIAVAKTYVTRELDCEERVKFLQSDEVCVKQ